MTRSYGSLPSFSALILHPRIDASLIVFRRKRRMELDEQSGRITGRLRLRFQRKRAGRSGASGGLSRSTPLQADATFGSGRDLRERTRPSGAGRRVSPISGFTLCALDASDLTEISLLTSPA